MTLDRHDIERMICVNLCALNYSDPFVDTDSTADGTCENVSFK